MLTAILIVVMPTHMPHVGHMAVHLSHCVQQHPEAALLSLIKALVKRLRRICDLFYFRGARGEGFSPFPQAFDQVPMFVMLLGLFMHFRHTRGPRLHHVTKNGFDGGPILLLRRSQLQPRFQSGDMGVCKGGPVLR